MEAWKSWHIDAAGATALGLLTLVFWLGGLQPRLQRHENSASQRAELTSQQVQAGRLDWQLSVLRDRLRTVQQSIAEKSMRLEPAASLNQRLASLASLATESGLKMSEIQPGQMVYGPYYRRVPMTVAGTGSYRMCTVFLNRLRKAFPDTIVSSFELSANTTDPAAAGPFRFNLEWHALAAQEPVTK